jgi:DnaJ-class molecular chaperone
MTPELARRIFHLHPDEQPAEGLVSSLFKQLARKWHPDKNSDPEATAIFQQINAAYATLTRKDQDEGDTQQRALKDR